MMKNKIMTVLLLVGAVCGQNIQAMGGARNFAKKVFHSKIAGAALLLEGSILSVQYSSFKAEVEELKNGFRSNRLSQAAQQEIKDTFAQYGYKNVKIVDGEGLGVVKNGAEIYCMVGDCEVAALEPKKLQDFKLQDFKNYFNGYQTLSKQEVFGALKHEICHLDNSDCFYRNVAAATLNGSTALLCAKTMRVAGANKKIAVGGYVGLMCGFVYMRTQLAQFQETRADKFAASTSKEAELLVSCLKKIGLSHEHAIKSYCEEECIKIAKQAAQHIMVFINRFTHDHPWPSERIDYLEVIAAHKRIEEKKIRGKEGFLSKVGAFGKQQREELGKLFRDEVSVDAKKIQIDPIVVPFVSAGISKTI
jgi:hypothetical protein